jgi:hypothetical protein
MEKEIQRGWDERGRTGPTRRLGPAPESCPVSGLPCEDYRDCRNRNYCWLKGGDADDPTTFRP